MKKIFLIILSLFIFSANIFSQIAYSQDGKGVQINLEGKSTKILLAYDDDNNPYAISIENEDNGFQLIANIKSDEGKLLSAELKEANSDFCFVANITPADESKNCYHSYLFRAGDFQDVANVNVVDKNKENLDAKIFRHTIINNSYEPMMTGYVCDAELNEILESVRANLKGSSLLAEFEKEQLAWENYKAAHLKMLFNENFDDEKNLSVQAKNEIKRMNAIRMSALINYYPTRKYDNKMELHHSYWNSFANKFLDYTATVFDEKIVVTFNGRSDGVRKIELPIPLVVEKIYDAFITRKPVEPEIEFDDYECSLLLKIGENKYKIVSENDDFTKTSPNYKNADLIIELHKYIMKKIKEQR